VFKYSTAAFFFAALLLLFSACNFNLGRIGTAGIPTPNIPAAEPDDANEDMDITPIAIEDVPVYEPGAAILRLSMRYPLTLNPLLNEDVTVARVLRLIFEPLIIFDENLRPTSHLAEIELASDFSSANLTIRSDAIWSDGMPVTADDVIFSIETLRAAPQGVIYKENVANIASTTRTSSRTVQITFRQASVTAAYALNFPIIPQHYYQGERNLGSTVNMNPVGNGLFMFDSTRPTRSITLVRSPYTFRSRAQIEQVEVIFLPDPQTELHAFDQGRIDALHLPLTEWIRHHSVRPLSAEIFPAMYFEFIGFNFRRDLFGEVNVRRAVAHSFDINAAISAIYLDHAVSAAAPIHPLSWAAGDVGHPAFDLTSAQALLATASPDILPEEPLVILVNRENPQRVSIAQRLAEGLNAINLPTRLASVRASEYFHRLENGDFDLYVGGMILTTQPDVQFMFQSGGLFASDPVLASAFAVMAATTTESAYIQAVEGFQQAFVDRLPVIGLAFRHSAMLTNTRISQGAPPMPDNVFYGVNYWSVGAGGF